MGGPHRYPALTMYAIGVVLGGLIGFGLGYNTGRGQLSTAMDQTEEAMVQTHAALDAAGNWCKAFNKLYEGPPFDCEFGTTKETTHD